GGGWRNERLAEELTDAIVAQDFKDVLDTAPPSSAATARVAAVKEKGYEQTPGESAKLFTAAAAAAPIHQTPNLDATVFELGTQGSVVAAANVLLSPQYPDGKVVPLDSNLATDQVRWRRWSDSGWDADNGRGSIDAVPGRENAPIDFMSPYPASVLKLMVGFGVLQLVDRHDVALDDVYAYDPTGAPNTACGGKTNKTIRRLFDEMITVSSNESTCSLIKVLHDHSAVEPLNQQFQDLGLPMLQLVGTRTVDGGHWADTQMNALDTAKLLLVVNGGPGTLWTTPNGTPVTKDLLSDDSRQFFLSKLGDNGLNQVLSTPNWCDRGYPVPGIPQLISSRWVNPTTGKLNVAGRNYNQDVRPCQETAEVTFAHKTGLGTNSGNDAGIVHSLPGKLSRHYIVVVHSNLGSRYIDVNRPATPAGTYAVQYTEKYAKLGAALDDAITWHRNR
ncbi:MAG: hypothetical protein QOF57_389, partial [Frankiaceae bacterium]|nr:hypothetical protein [Frankiaceae bacterium]